MAIERFDAFVRAGAGLPREEEFYAADPGILGSEEFVDAMIHRIGEHDVFAAARRRNEAKAAPECDLETLAAVVGEMFEVSKDDLCSRGKSSRLVFAREVLILSGRRLGASLAEISDLISLSPSTVSRRCDAAKLRSSTDRRVPKAVGRVIKEYAAREQGRIAILQV